MKLDWHLVEAELRARGHDVLAPDLPGDDDALELEDYADAIVAAVGEPGGNRGGVGASSLGVDVNFVTDRLAVHVITLCEHAAGGGPGCNKPAVSKRGNR